MFGGSLLTTHRLALIGTVVLSAAGIMPGSTILAAGGGLLMGTAAVSTGWLFERKPGWMRFLVHGATVLGLVTCILLLRVLRVDAVLLVVMLGIFNRLALWKGSRDDYVIVAAASVLMAMATTITPGLAFVPLLFTFLPAALWTLSTATVLADSEAESKAAGRPHRRPARLPAPSYRFGLAAPMVILTVLGYAGASIFPRYNFARALSVGAFLPMPGADQSLKLSTGGLSSLGSDNTVMVWVEPASGIWDGPPIYARLFALDRFEVGGWSATEDARPRSLEKIEVEPDVDGWVKDGWVKVRVRRTVQPGEPVPVVLVGSEGPTRLQMDGVLRDTAGTLYAAHSLQGMDVDYRAQPGASDDFIPPPDSPEALLSVPAGLSPEVRGLAERLTAGLENPKDRLEAVLRYFKSDFVYSLDPLPGESPDPLYRFLFEARQGHCELYAGSLAALLRLSGIPARVVTGFYGGWWNRRSRSLELTNDDAHAWVEAYVGERWVWVDATPAERRTRRDGKWFSWARDYWDYLEAQWYVYVLDFDEQKRRALFERATEGAKAAVSQAGSWWGGPDLGQSREVRRGLARWWVGVLAVAGVASVWWVRRRRTPSRLLRLGRRLRRRLGLSDSIPLRMGLDRSKLPESARQPAEDAIALYERLRFGPTHQAPPLTELERAIRRLDSIRR